MSLPTTPAPGHGDIVAYVRSAARLQALPLSDAQIDRVAVHLARTAVLAAALQQVPLADHDEPAEIYAPAPFPQASP